MGASMNGRLFVLGDAVVDQLYFVPHFPEHGGEVAVSRSLVTPGGSASNVAVALAKLGEAVGFAARTGMDELSGTALINHVLFEVSSNWVQFDAERPTSTVSVFITPDGERTMVSAPGASRHLDVSQFQSSDLQDFQAVVFSSYCFIGDKQREYAEAVMQAARRLHLPIIIDIGTAAFHALGREALLEACRGTTHLLMNEHELALLSGIDDAASANGVSGESRVPNGIQVMHDAGFESVVVKRGARGATVSLAGEMQDVMGVNVPEVVDSTGAGDAFTAGFAYGVVRGWSHPEAARVGNVLGALTTKALGGQAAKFDRTLIEDDAALSFV